MLDGEFKKSVELKLAELYQEPVVITGFSVTGGGSISHSGRIHTDKGYFFLKWNKETNGSGMFQAEIKGLQTLRLSNTLYIPEVIASGAVSQFHFLLLEYFNVSKAISDQVVREAGKKLALLHKHSNAAFGLEYDNFIGSLRQINTQKSSWKDFFIECRLEPLLQTGVNKGLIAKNLVGTLENLYKRADEIFPAELPSLLHGDLWSGNILFSATEGALIDPAVYYGFREMDLAMGRLFGGVQESFYEGYTEEWPLAPGWKQRIEICNLYPLLVHVHLFGEGYVAAVVDVLKRFK